MTITSVMAVSVSVPVQPGCGKPVKTLSLEQQSPTRMPNASGARVCFVFGWAYLVEQVARTAEWREKREREKHNIMENGRFYGYDEGDE
jgi:hypothetical protein